jgi:hypothetical protein
MTGAGDRDSTRGASVPSEVSGPRRRMGDVQASVARVARLALLPLVAGLFTVAVERRFATVRTVCMAADECHPDQLRPDGARALAELGPSLDAYAAYTVALGSSFALLMLVVGGMLLWRRGAERGALAIALLLVYLGLYFSALYDVLHESGWSGTARPIRGHPRPVAFHFPPVPLS